MNIKDMSWALSVNLFYFLEHKGGTKQLETFDNENIWTSSDLPNICNMIRGIFSLWGIFLGGPSAHS